MNKYRKLVDVGETVVYDVRRKSDVVVADDALLRDFLYPSPPDEPLEAILHLPDNTTCIRRLPHLLRQLPTEVLYDAKGLDLFDRLTKLEEYYLTRCEKEIIAKYMGDIVQNIPDGASLIELGCGNMSKTTAILDRLYASGKRDLSFYALDIDESYLVESVQALLEDQRSRDLSKENVIDIAGILGSYDEALDSILADVPSPRVFLWLGSSIGNWTRTSAEDLVGRFGAVMEPEDLVIMGIDRRNDPATVARAYNDAQGVSAAFGLNGIRHLNDRLGGIVFPPDNFAYYAGYNPEMGRNEAYYRSTVDQIISIPGTDSEAAVDVRLEKNELIRYEMSHKYSSDDIRGLAASTGFRWKNSWFDDGDMYRMCLFEKKRLPPMTSAVIPSLHDWREVWQRWDTVSGDKMIKNYTDQPIDLRHPMIFYLGHIPAFCDLMLSKGLDEPVTEPAYYGKIFERGIDPDVEDPTVCHPHSTVPDAWPSIDAILDYKSRVRQRVREVYGRLDRGRLEVSKRKLGRVLHMAIEHEIMHSETLLNMIVQNNIDPLVHDTMLDPSPKQLIDARWTTVNGGEVILGTDHGEEKDDRETLVPTSFGWDNESPERSIKVDSFQMQHRPVTNFEYLCFLKMLPTMPDDLVPSSFGRCEDSSSYGVKTVDGVIPMKHSMNWPVALNHHQASAFAKHLQISLKDNSIHIPTEAELMRFYDQFRSSMGSETNVGFRHWRPVDLSDDAVHVMGSVWEWTSTILEAHSGFVPSTVYPGYTSDFFEGKHNIVKGGSWATHPRLVGRLRNFYQRSYGYAFIGVRFARCLEE